MAQMAKDEGLPAALRARMFAESPAYADPRGAIAVLTGERLRRTG
jgi:hypothetical protein